MLGYVLSRPLTLVAASQTKTLPAAARFAQPTADEVHISAQRELDFLRRALRSTYPDDDPAQILRVIASEQMARLPGLPAMLGSGGYTDPLSAPNHCLPGQLRDLQATHPLRGHYRLLLVNAFGSNLGDTLIGLTAYRQVYQVLVAELPEVSVDVLLGWHKDDRLNRLFRGAPGVENILSQGMSLSQLSRYQGIFDTSGLLSLPRYRQMAVVDWYLWWMGLDPSRIPAEDKRNSLSIPAEAMQFARQHLPLIDGPRILINPRASVELRTMPQAVTKRLVEYLLAAWPTAQVVVTQPLMLKHPRVFSLAWAIPTVDHLAALVAQVDGLIGVDTYTQHVADATATPAVTIYTSVHPDRYPYYPLVEPVLLPNARSLPAWNREKVDRADWRSMQATYTAAWEQLDINLVLQTLQRAMDRRMAQSVRSPAPLEPALTNGTHARQWYRDTLIRVAPGRRRQEPLAVHMDHTVAEIGRQALLRGDTAVVLGAGAGESTLGLAELVGRHGRVVAVEPRRELHQVLCANIVGAGIDHVETHCVMPEGQGVSVNRIYRLRIDDDFSPLALANGAEAESVVCWPLDSLPLPACRLLAVLAPLPLLSVLKGAAATIGRLRPVVVAGVFDRRHSQALASFFDPLVYSVRVLPLGPGPDPEQYGMVVAEPLVTNRPALQWARLVSKPSGGQRLDD